MRSKATFRQDRQQPGPQIQAQLLSIGTGFVYPSLLKMTFLDRPAHGNASSLDFALEVADGMNAEMKNRGR